MTPNEFMRELDTLLEKAGHPVNGPYPFAWTALWREAQKFAYENLKD